MKVYITHNKLIDNLIIYKVDNSNVIFKISQDGMVIDSQLCYIIFNIVFIHLFLFLFTDV